MNDEEPASKDMMDVMAARKRILILFAVIAGVAALAITPFLKKTYTSSALIFPKQAQTGLIGMGDNILPLAGLLNQGKDNYILLLLKSRTLKTAVIDSLDLRHEPLFATGKKTDRIPETDLIAKLSDITKIRKKREGGIEIAVYARTPELALSISESTLEELEKIIRINHQEESDFLADRIGQTRAELADAEDELRRFMESHPDVALSEKSSGLIDTFLELARGKLEIELEIAGLSRAAGAAGSLSDLSQFELDRQTLESKLTELNYNIEAFDTRLGGLPAGDVELFRILRKLKLHELVLGTLVKQHELAKITAMKKGALFTIIDPPFLPSSPAAPSYPINALIGLAAGLILGVVVAFTAQALKK